MNDVRQWFEEASLVTNVHKDFNSEFLIYKGFKITKKEGSYRIQDVRHSEFYSPVSIQDLNEIKEKGFIAGIDYINYVLNLGRVENYKLQVDTLKLKKKLARKELRQGIDRRLNNKRIRLANENILEYEDLIQLTESRIKQFNFKYNKNE